MDRSQSPPPTREPNAYLGRLLRPTYLLPAAVVIGALLLAVVVQPAPRQTDATDKRRVESVTTPTAPSSTPAPPSPASTRAAATPTPESDVAGARSTPTSPTPTIDATLFQQPTQCGTIQETTAPLAVEQAIGSISVRVTSVAVYPLDYLTCILVANGSNESLQLATALRKHETAGSTHVALVELWVANGSKLFGQLNLRSATLAAAGQTFPVIATLQSRAEVVLASGQGRSLTLVAPVRNTVGQSIGPITLVIDGPLAGGTPVAGKYQLFLPIP